ncbi:winged helix-turn-helix domain-containing protein [Glutamicibacter sp.]|uniref:winged helix-turn-helix domain-containing protein n=1 Tax=Glutamicibacter sp. TaxID=1931995 RepID=UPI002FE17CBF
MSPRKMTNAVQAISQLQVDSVNVVRRAHYMPIFARLGAYDITALDKVLATPGSALTEYWAHEASIVSSELVPDLLLWQRRTWIDKSHLFTDEQQELSRRVINYLEANPGSSAREISTALEVEPVTSKEHWGWNWNDTKYVTESLFARAQILTLGRNSQFERRYALTHHVLGEPLEVDEVHRQDALERLINRSLAAQGVATAHCVAEYFRLPIREVKTQLAQQANAGRIEQVQVTGINEPCYMPLETTIPRNVSKDLRLLSPFDSMVFNRRRLERFFDFEYRIEIYVPEAKRRYGYYVFPMLYGDEFVGRVDLKADRARGVLHAKSVHFESGWEAEVHSPLQSELERMAAWLGLDSVQVGCEPPVRRIVVR